MMLMQKSDCFGFLSGNRESEKKNYLPVFPLFSRRRCIPCCPPCWAVTRSQPKRARTWTRWCPCSRPPWICSWSIISIRRSPHSSSATCSTSPAQQSSTPWWQKVYKAKSRCVPLNPNTDNRNHSGSLLEIISCISHVVFCTLNLKFVSKKDFHLVYIVCLDEAGPVIFWQMNKVTFWTNFCGENNEHWWRPFPPRYMFPEKRLPPPQKLIFKDEIEVLLPFCLTAVFLFSCVWQFLS